MKKAFTLTETLIVLFVIGILSTVLIKTYLQMSNISFRVEQEKNVTQEVLFVSEVLQNLADRNSIDYDAYEDYFNNSDDFDSGIAGLTDANGLVDILFLSGLDGHTTIYSVGENEGDCIHPQTDYSAVAYMREGDDIPRCHIVLKQDDGTEVILSNNKKAYLSQAVFKIIPFATTNEYFSEESQNLCQTNYLACPHHPGFWLVMKAYSNNYGLKWSNNILIPVQQFFNLQ